MRYDVMSNEKQHLEYDSPVFHDKQLPKTIIAKQKNSPEKPTFMTIMQTVNSAKESSLAGLNNAKSLDQKKQRKFDKSKQFNTFTNLFCDLRQVKDLSNEQMHSFFTAIQTELGTSWISFLTKVSLMVDPQKTGNHRKLLAYIIDECEYQFSKYNLDSESINDFLDRFKTPMSGNVIVEFLDYASSQVNDESTARIPQADLICLTFILFTLNCRQLGSNAFELQTTIDREIAEYVYRTKNTHSLQKELAGTTLGNILGQRAFYPKQICELVYLHADQSRQVNLQAQQIALLQQERLRLLARNSELLRIVDARDQTTQSLTLQIDSLSAECARLRKERDASDSMLAYEKNRYATQMASKEADIAGQLTEEINLEMQALRDLVDYLAEDDQRRFRRRLDRIEKYLQEFGGTNV